MTSRRRRTVAPSGHRIENRSVSRRLRLIGERAPRRQREHQACCPAKHHVDTREGAKHPRGVQRPRSPNDDGEDRGDDSIEEQPSGPWHWPEPERQNKLQRRFHDEVDGKG